MILLRYKIKSYLELCRVQSTPVTIIILSLGFGIAKGTLLHLDIIALYIMGALGHWGFYAMNDIMDREHDRQGDDLHKPIPSGKVSLKGALILCVWCIIMSLLIAAVILGQPAFAYYTGAMTLGWVYNLRSKKDTFASMYLAAWAVLILMTGYHYGV